MKDLIHRAAREALENGLSAEEIRETIASAIESHEQYVAEGAVVDEAMVLHVWGDAEQVYTRLGFHEYIAEADEERYASALSDAWQAARRRPGERAYLRGISRDPEYVVVFTAAKRSEEEGE